MNDALREENLKLHGFNGGKSLQSPMKNNPELFEYIFPYFTLQTNYYDEIPNSEIVFEGAKKEIVVNRYERSHEARDRCIAACGCKCAVCGMDFKQTYGDIGQGFIHVHHLVPISSIGENYEIDHIKDLVPVCPNCHNMLHRKEPPYTPEELKMKLKSKH
jgi:5-methylcytosine-specific restriction protein A